MTESDRLAKAAKALVDEIHNIRLWIPIACAMGVRVEGVRAALAAYDAAKELREAEREYLEAQYALDKLDLEPGTTDEYQAALTAACETFDRLYALRQALLAARAKVDHGA